MLRFQKFYESLTNSKYKEIEFVCANSEFKNSTSLEAQKKLYQDLKKIDGVIPLWQDWSDEDQTQFSLTAIFKDPNIQKDIIKLAKNNGVQIDIIQNVDDNYVDRAIRGEHVGQIMESYEEDFDSKWKNAVNSSEELRVALDLMKNIKAKNSGDIYIVGGVPRDLLMGNEIDDVDMATNIPFEAIAKDFDIRNISKNDSQPVYTILWKGYNFDLAKFREDSGDVGRQNNVSTETDSFEADSKRRDLTINAFGLDENGAIVDYQGGLEDLKNKIVRAVGDPKKRFIEDATRILRVFRFAAKMDFDIEENTKRAAIELKGLLSDSSAISMESISKEFYKSAKSGRTLANFLKKLQDTGILHDILPEFTSMEGYSHNPKHHPEGDSQVLGHIYECLKVSPYNDPVINLAVLFHDFGKATTRGEKDGHSTYHGHEEAGVPIVEGIFKRLRFAELGADDKKNILAAVDRHMLIHNLDKLNPKTLSKLILSPSWETIKAVGYCDEASRGVLFDEDEFWAKIQRAESKVQNLGGNEDELRKRLKQYVDGNKLMTWFPQLRKQPALMKEIMPKIHEYIIDTLDAGQEPEEEKIKTIASDNIPIGENLNKDMREFDKLYRELMEAIWQPKVTIPLGITRKKEDSGFDQDNPLIREFAMSSPDNLAMVFAFVFYTMQTPWAEVLHGFPKFIEWFYTKAVIKKGNRLMVNRNVKPPSYLGHLMTGENEKTGLASEKLTNFYDVYDNRNKHYENIVKRIDNVYELFDYVVGINGLAKAKAAFVVQLISGNLGCFDSVNVKSYDISHLNTDSPSRDKHGKLTKGGRKNLEKYIEYSNPMAKELWDDWCEIIENKFLFAGKYSKDEKDKVIATDIGGVINTQSAYNPNIRTGDRIKDYTDKRLKGSKMDGRNVSRDHYTIFKDIEPFIKKESLDEIEGEFNKMYRQLMEEYL